MKFGKNLQNLIEEALPEWRDKFLSYKDLKKRLKLMSPIGVESKETEGASQAPRKRRRIEPQEAPAGVAEGRSESSVSSDGSNQAEAVGAPDREGFRYQLTAEETDFIQLLNPELEKFNLFFTDKEEEYIIRQKEIQERIQRIKEAYGPQGTFPSRVKYKHEMINVGKEIVNFHGEMVLLENYSVLNYTGLVKILKKYDKRTGGRLRLAFIQRVLEQPFFTLELLFKLVKECEEILQRLFSADEEGFPEQETAAAEEEGAVYLGEEEMYRSAVAAFRNMLEMRKGSSTYSPLSLPPLSLRDLHLPLLVHDDKPCVLPSSATPICPQS
uniref:TSA: Wollemia nobilis Ref_Wollemi_Transcript_10688_1465 transcribed RNA sequence n=1 Tax=Wollemia nobilis TaxID=56998 RepID=A0A0C9S8Q9_9CONI